MLILLQQISQFESVLTVDYDFIVLNLGGHNIIWHNIKMLGYKYYFNTSISYD